MRPRQGCNCTPFQQSTGRVATYCSLPCFRMLLLYSVATLLLSSTPVTTAFAPPTLGLTSLLFPPRNTQLVSLLDLQEQDPRNFNHKGTLGQAAEFFVDAFWTAKIGGGATALTPRQQSSLTESQRVEFNKRYGKSRLLNKSQFLMITQETPQSSSPSQQQILACVGVELDVIRADGLLSPRILDSSAPLMSNLAVSRNQRRRGLAEQLVQAVEDFIQQEWPEQEACYLLVEARNRGAVRLYEKMGYQTIWTDDGAETLLPMADGSLDMVPTEILCMKKTLGRNRNPLLRLFGKNKNREAAVVQ